MTAENPLSVIQTTQQRLQSLGPDSLSTVELLALVIGAGKASNNAVEVAQQLILRHGGLTGLARQNVFELSSEQGMGIARAAQIDAALTLAKRLVQETISDRPQIKCPADAARLLMLEMSQLDQEHFRVLLLDTRHHVLGDQLLYIGNVDSSIIRAGEVYREAIRRNCAAIIVAHNHPSGDPSPSPEDIGVTRVLVEAGQLLDIMLLDHLVIGHGKFVSLKERGLGFK